MPPEDATLSHAHTVAHWQPRLLDLLPFSRSLFDFEHLIRVRELKVSLALLGQAQVPSQLSFKPHVPVQAFRAQ
jgi:hypothetical protein